MSSGPARQKRSYDARRRRERAAEERQATRNRVIDAASRLFVAKGYTGTTMAEIAREAGVAMQSVYTAGRGKADLLSAAVERAVAGDDQEVMVHDRYATLLADERDPVRQIQILAAFACDIQERSAPLQLAYRQAAAVDATVAKSVEDAHRRRRETTGMVINMLPAERLRLRPEECADIVWALTSAETNLLLRNVLGWTWPEIRAWLPRTLEDLLLKPAS